MGLCSQTFRPVLRWVLPNVVGALIFIASAVGFARWSGYGLLPFAAVFVVPIAVGLQCAVAWIARGSIRSTWIGSAIIWLVPCLFLGWTSYEWQKPERVFTRITNFAVPDGVANLRARMEMGIDGFGWIHFDATGQAKQDLISKAGLTPDDQLNGGGATNLLNYGVNSPMRRLTFSAPPTRPLAYRSGSHFKTTDGMKARFEHAVWVIDQEGSGVWILF